MSPTSRVWFLLVAFVMVVGVVARLIGLTTLELWSDEARWCEHLLTGAAIWMRPAGYMWVTRQILDAFGVSAPALRSLSTIAGILLLPLTYLLLLRVVRHRAVALVATWILAIHPVAVAMSKEFKPYIVEALMHGLLLGLALLVLDGRRRRLWLGLLCVTSAIAPFFAWTVVFAYPGLYLVVGFNEWRARRFRDLASLAVGCGVTLAILVGIFLARLTAREVSSEYWGRKYDVFYVGDGPLGFVGWFIRRTAELASFPAHLQMPWPLWLEWCVYVVGIVLVAAGIASLFAERRTQVAALLVAPWGVMVLFNVVGAWPYGMFRTNTFMLFYTLLLGAVGLDAIVTFVAARDRLRPAAIVLATVLVILTLPFEAQALVHKGSDTMTGETSVRAALERIYEFDEGRTVSAPVDDGTLLDRILEADRAKRSLTEAITIDQLSDQAALTKPLLVLDGHACTIVRYYRDLDDETSAVFEDWLPAHFTMVCAGYAKAALRKTLRQLSGREFWLVSAKPGLAKSTREAVAPLCEVDVDVTIPPATHLLHCRPRADLVASPPLDQTAD